MENTSTIQPDNQLFYTLTHNSDVKKTYGEIYIAPNLSLIDISLKGRGRKEDHLYATSQFLRENVRRGGSFLEEDTKGITICRRGLQKFFDLKDEYLEILQGITDFRGAKLDKDEQKLFHVIFDEVEQSFYAAKTVTVYKTEKANGENAQVAYNAKYDAWIIASKNVSMMVRNAEDIRVYKESATKNRYAFAILIAEAWLEIVSKHVKDLEGLKKELEGKTMIGEYCGHPKHQHLVEYKEITIYFFALVDMHSNRTCYPMSVCKEFFTKYNLPMVRITPRKECSNTRELVSILEELAREVAQNTIEEDAEGSVVYFEVANENGNEILSLCKVKTLEYRVYRKLREKLKTMISKGKSVTDQMRAYKKEVAQLCYRYNLPNPTDYYYSIAQLAMEFVDSRRDIASRLGLSNRYLDFLKVIKACKSKGVKPKAEHFEKLISEANDLSGDSDIGDEKAEEEEEKPKPTKKKNERKKEQKTKTKAKKSWEDSEEEEKKDEEEEEVVIDRSGWRRVVIITPPLYFDTRTVQKLQELQEEREIEEEWNEDTVMTGNKSVTLLHRFPEVTKGEELEKNTFFIVTGFKEGKNLTVKKLDNLAKYGVGDMKFNKAEVDCINSENRAQKMEQLWADQKSFSENIVKILPNNYSELQVSKPEKIIEDVVNIFNKLASRGPGAKPQVETEPKAPKPKAKKGKKQILVFIPTGLPGMGKSTHFKKLAEIFESKGIPVTVISSDKVRKELMDECIEEDPSLTHQQAFDRTNKEAKPKFFEYVGKAVEKTSTLVQDMHVVMLDKNHPPSIIQEALDFFRNPKYKKEYVVKVTVIKPICGEGFRTKEGAFPFSLTFFMKCMQRVLNRDEHETLVGDDTKMASVLFGFFNSHRNFRATSLGFVDMGADLVVELPFTYEDEQVEKELREVMGDVVGRVLRSFKGFEAGKEEVKEFLEKMKGLEIELKDPDQEELQGKTVKAIEKCRGLFTNTT